MKIRAIAAMTGTVMVLLAAAMPCFAAYREQPVSVSLSVAVQEDGSGEFSKIVVEESDALEEDRILSVKEGKTAELTFQMEEPGSRTYRIYQLEGTRKEVNYDRRIYTAVVFAWTEGSGLRGTVVLHRDGELEKPAEVVFQNREIPRQESSVPEPPVRTGDDTMVRLWSGIGVAAAAAAGFLFLAQVKGRKKE